MPLVPVLVQRCGCCPVAVDWYWMLDTQHIHNLAWNEQWSDTTSTSLLSPCQVSSHLDQIEGLFALSLERTDVLLEGEVRFPPQLKNFFIPQLAGVCHWSWLWGVSELCIGVPWNAQPNIYGLHTWNHSSLPIPLWHLLPAADVSGIKGAPMKTYHQIINKEYSENVQYEMAAL